MTSTRKLFRRLGAIGVLVLGLMGVNLAPASAHVLTYPATPYNDGYGEFTATTVPLPPNCSRYSNYVANLEFPNDGATATVRSGPPTNVWQEFWDGTYTSPTCDQGTADPEHGNGGDRIGGFTGTLVKGNSVCSLSNGTYQRGHLGALDTTPPSYNDPELNIMYEFNTVTVVRGSGCPTASSTTPLRLKTTIVHVHHQPIQVGPFVFEYTTACDSPIAPQNCELGPQEQNSW